jgi:hypothetical protein
VRFWGSIGQDAQLRSGGPWMALRDDPQNCAGGRGFLRSKNQQAGWPFFWLLFFGHAKKSNSPKARCFKLGFFMGCRLHAFSHGAWEREIIVPEGGRKLLLHFRHFGHPGRQEFYEVKPKSRVHFLLVTFLCARKKK